jgi:hypothetical protein
VAGSPRSDDDKAGTPRRRPIVLLLGPTQTDRKKFRVGAENAVLQPTDTGRVARAFRAARDQQAVRSPTTCLSGGLIGLCDGVRLPHPSDAFRARHHRAILGLCIRSHPFAREMRPWSILRFWSSPGGSKSRHHRQASRTCYPGGCCSAGLKRSGWPRCPVAAPQGEPRSPRSPSADGASRTPYGSTRICPSSASAF